MQEIQLEHYSNPINGKNLIVRCAWIIIWTLFVRPIPRRSLCFWKRFLLRVFGAKIDNTAVIYSSAKIFYPKNLEMDKHSCLASNVNCYNVDRVVIGSNATVSQGAFLCTASHDITKSTHPLITAPITVEDQAWIAAEAFIGMGVTIGQGAVVGARAAVFKDVDPWTVVGGNPAKFIKKREIKS